MNSPAFDFYEEVRVNSSDQTKAHLNGALGVILGRTESEDQSTWYYAVDLNGEDSGWCFYENELLPTGRKFSREDFYNGDSVKVRVDKDGRGTLL